VINFSEGVEEDEIDRSRPSFGDWTDEVASAAEFDRRVDACGLFERVFREVEGFYMAHRPNRQGKDARIDRVLLPGRKLRDAGWSRVIGVELKRSGEKIGRPLAQAIDYTYCAWNVAHYWMMAENVFLWPFPKQHRALESVMLQNAVGVVYESKHCPLVFQLEKRVIQIGRDGTVQVQAPTSGVKVGSR
jgi:hypothetical protein